MTKKELRNLEKRQDTLLRRLLDDDYKQRFSCYGILFETIDMIVYYKKLIISSHIDNKYDDDGSLEYHHEKLEEYKKQLTKYQDMLNKHIEFLKKI